MDTLKFDLCYSIRSWEGRWQMTLWFTAIHSEHWKGTFWSWEVHTGSLVPGRELESDISILNCTNRYYDPWQSTLRGQWYSPNHTDTMMLNSHLCRYCDPRQTTGNWYFNPQQFLQILGKMLENDSTIFS